MNETKPSDEAPTPDGRWRTFKNGCPRTFPEIPMVKVGVYQGELDGCDCVDCVEIRNAREVEFSRAEIANLRGLVEDAEGYTQKLKREIDSAMSIVHAFEDRESALYEALKALVHDCDLEFQWGCGMCGGPRVVIGASHDPIRSRIDHTPTCSLEQARKALLAATDGPTS